MAKSFQNGLSFFPKNHFHTSNLLYLKSRQFLGPVLTKVGTCKQPVWIWCTPTLCLSRPPTSTPASPQQPLCSCWATGTTAVVSPSPCSESAGCSGSPLCHISTEACTREWDGVIYGRIASRTLSTVLYCLRYFTLSNPQQNPSVILLPISRLFVHLFLVSSRQLDLNN